MLPRKAAAACLLGNIVDKVGLYMPAHSSSKNNRSVVRRTVFRLLQAHCRETMWLVAYRSSYTRPSPARQPNSEAQITRVWFSNPTFRLAVRIRFDGLPIQQGAITNACFVQPSFQRKMHFGANRSFSYGTLPRSSRSKTYLYHKLSLTTGEAKDAFNY